MKEMIRTKKFLVITFTCLTITLISAAQTRDEIYRKPLKDVLDMVENRYNVKISCPERLTEGKTVEYAWWRFRSDVGTTLHNILGPFDYVFNETSKGNYLVEPFNYSTRTPDEGKKELSRLFAMTPTLEKWEARKKTIRETYNKVLGFPLIARKNPLNPIYTGKKTMNGYTVEHLSIETLPGVYLSGSLYKPVNVKGKSGCAGIAVAQGHFPSQHYSGYTQLLCATLARMGAVVFAWDMFAYAGTESELQFDSKEHHTPFAERMQIWSCQRAIDFLLSLPEVDHERIGMTGCSGGGTQTFIATALDDRIKVAVPVGMVSTWMYGGCECETGMPLQCSVPDGGTDNAEVAAMAAPRPMLVVSIGHDWTANCPEIDMPYLKKIYAYYGKESVVENAHIANEYHDYGPSKRKPVYPFLAKHLGLDLKAVTDANGNVDESKTVIEDKRDMLVFGVNGERLPANAIHGIDKLKKMLEEDKVVNTEYNK
jgi:hypothetical protein